MSGDHTHALREVTIPDQELAQGDTIQLPSLFNGYGSDPEPNYINGELIYIFPRNSQHTNKSIRLGRVYFDRGIEIDYNGSPYNYRPWFATIL